MKSIYAKFTGFLLLVLLLAGNCILAQDLNKLQEKSFPVKSGELLKADLLSADIQIEAWDKDEVFIEALGDDRVNEKVRINIEKESTGIIIKTNFDRTLLTLFGKGYTLKFVIKVPKKFNLDLTVNSGNVYLTGVVGNLKVKTVDGNIDVKECAWQLTANTSSGYIKVIDVNSKVISETSGGDITITSVGELGDISAVTSDGDINITRSKGKLKCETSAGKITIVHEGENKGISATASDGEIKVTVPADLKANGEFKTSGGEIDFNFTNMNIKKFSPGALTTTLNGGGPELFCETSGGKITITEIKDGVTKKPKTQVKEEVKEAPKTEPNKEVKETAADTTKVKPNKEAKEEPK